jgi:hypothetical protein
VVQLTRGLGIAKLPHGGSLMLVTLFAATRLAACTSIGAAGAAGIAAHATEPEAARR